jgi:transposase
MGTFHGHLSRQASKRLRAGDLIERGFDNEEIMEILEASLSSVKRWRKKVNEEGLSGLSRKSGTGRTSKLSCEQLAELKEIVLKGAIAAGYPTDRWTSRIVADLIRKKWNIRYCRSQVRKILNDLGLSYQKPDVKSTKHSQEVVEHWKEYDWRRIKKSGRERLGAVHLG